MALSWKELDKQLIFQGGVFYGNRERTITTDNNRK